MYVTWEDLYTMPIPPSKREVYSRNPLDEVICQLRFPSILQVTAVSPSDFQNLIRYTYPLYEEEPPMPGWPQEIAGLLAGVPFPKGIQPPVHKFLTENKRAFISISNNFLAVSERDYERWEDFREQIERAEKAFREVYNPSFFSRIGLRYRDVIDKDELGLGEVPWHDLLNESMLGLLGTRELRNEVSQCVTQARIRLEDGFVNIMHGLASRGDPAHQVYVFDADFYVERRSEPENAFETLDKFNNLGGRFFRWAISPKLRSALDPKPLG